jgi:hypothetical protein
MLLILLRWNLGQMRDLIVGSFRVSLDLEYWGIFFGFQQFNFIIKYYINIFIELFFDFYLIEGI